MIIDAEELREGFIDFVIDKHAEVWRAKNRQMLKSTSYYEYVKFGGDLPIRLKNQQPPKRRLADFL